jgi:hypothetical protein
LTPAASYFLMTQSASWLSWVWVARVPAAACFSPAMIALRTAGSVIGVDGPTLRVVAVLDVFGVLGAAGVLGAGVLAALLLLLLELPHPAAAIAATLKINATWGLPSLVIDPSNHSLRRRHRRSIWV